MPALGCGSWASLLVPRDLNKVLTAKVGQIWVSEGKQLAERAQIAGLRCSVACWGAHKVGRTEVIHMK